MPVNSNNFEHPLRDQAFTALAGPLANLLLAVVSAIPFSYLPNGPWIDFSGAVLNLSLTLFIFNMLPFPPLDGSKFYVLFLPRRFQASYDVFLRKSMPYFIIVVLADLYLSQYFFGASLIWTAVSAATFWLKAAILLIV